jgi:deoxycytidine triphosphate deaminase/intein/homing endonuclease
VILSDVSIQKALAEGRIVIEPLMEGGVQPSSVDLRVDRYFRVFRNDTTPFIDPKLAQEDLTELVEVAEDKAFILHPGEFVLGSTLERVALPDDLVARLEGKSSLGRLGLLIHSSLPASETVFVHDGERLARRPIGEVVAKQLPAFVVGFDPETFEVGYHRITGWYEGPADRIFEVRLASGRRVRVTAGHNLFTLDREGRLAKVRTGALRPGLRVAVPHRIPDPPVPSDALDVLALVPEDEYANLVCEGSTIAQAFAERGPEIDDALREAGFRHVDHYRNRARLPLDVARQLGVLASLGTADRFSVRGGRHGFPCRVTVDTEVAWLLGIYVAQGCRRASQFTVSNTDQDTLDRIEAVLRRLNLPVYRGAGAITCCSAFAARMLGWLGTGDGARHKRVPPIVFGWSLPLIESFLEGVVDGDGSLDATRTSVWTTSDELVGDLLLLSARMGRRAGSTWKQTSTLLLSQVHLPTGEHKLLTSVPLPDHLLVEVRNRAELDQATASRRAGYKHASDLDNLERRSGRDAVRFATLHRLLQAYDAAAETDEYARLERLVEGDLLWDRVVDVHDTGVTEPIFDLEVRPDGRHVENFLAGHGGVFVSNTAGFVDAGWDGHLTLELSNVANLPIAIYPGMKIGQISFLQMTTAAENPYGSGAAGSKYQGQRGPTPSRYYQNFKR